MTSDEVMSSEMNNEEKLRELFSLHTYHTEEKYAIEEYIKELIRTTYNSAEE